MAFFPIREFFILNGNLKPVTEFVPSENSGGIYEVLRVESGIPLFFDEHLSRLFNSALIAKKTLLFSKLDIKRFLADLIKNNGPGNGNVLISCKPDLRICYIAHKYPTSEMFANGVKCGILEAERENPNAKILQTSVRQKTNELIFDNDFYEVLLVDNYGRITEGSRSNIFFVEGDKIITPNRNIVLEGITRQKTIQLANSFGFRFSEKDVFLDELSVFDAMFLTGTSPKILPVNQVEELIFDAKNSIVGQLMAGYNNLVEDYINLRK